MCVVAPSPHIPLRPLCYLLIPYLFLRVSARAAEWPRPLTPEGAAPPLAKHSPESHAVVPPAHDEARRAAAGTATAGHTAAVAAVPPGFPTAASECPAGATSSSEPVPAGAATLPYLPCGAETPKQPPKGYLGQAAALPAERDHGEDFSSLVFPFLSLSPFPLPLFFISLCFH